MRIEYVQELLLYIGRRAHGRLVQTTFTTQYSTSQQRDLGANSWHTVLWSSNALSSFIVPFLFDE
jgi:hypothetical protein